MAGSRPCGMKEDEGKGFRRRNGFHFAEAVTEALGAALVDRQAEGP